LLDAKSMAAKPSKIKIARRSGRSTFALAAIIFTAITAHAAEVIPPKPAAYFNDYAGIISKSAALRFNEQLAQFERETSNQVVVVVFPKMQSDDDVAAYTQRIAHNWAVGQKDKRNGVVLFVFVQDRKIFIQAGYGLEGALPDATAFDIYENRIKPHFRNNDYEGGLAEGIDSIFKAVRGEYKGTGQTVRQRESRGHSLPGNLIFFLIFLGISFLLSRIKPRRGYHYSSGGGGWAWSYGGGGGGWSSSGGGGGGGFSGFSGGGGDFGGGGAGGSW
jgi:uncharacterized protein